MADILFMFIVHLSKLSVAQTVASNGETTNEYWILKNVKESDLGLI